MPQLVDSGTGTSVCELADVEIGRTADMKLVAVVANTVIIIGLILVALLVVQEPMTVGR